MFPLGVLNQDGRVFDLPLATNLIDRSKYNLAVVAAEGTPVFSGNRLVCNNNVALKIPSPPTLGMGASNFTLEGYFEVAGFCYLINIQEGTLALRLSVTGTNSLKAQFQTPYQVSTADNAITLNVRHHFAVVRVGNTVNLYLNGTLAGTTTVSGGLLSSVSNADWFIGGYKQTSTIDFKVTGFLDNFKLTKKAIYLANFTPPLL